MFSFTSCPGSRDHEVTGAIGHFVQVPRLTGAIGHFVCAGTAIDRHRSNHDTSEKTNPGGGGLVRAWCGPGAGLARAWCGDVSRSDRRFDRKSRANHCSHDTSEKNPGAGLVRAWCGPGAGLVRAPRPKPRSRPRSKTEAAEPASLLDRRLSRWTKASGKHM